jgi:hypothetical protein
MEELCDLRGIRPTWRGAVRAELSQCGGYQNRRNLLLDVSEKDTDGLLNAFDVEGRKTCKGARGPRGQGRDNHANEIGSEFSQCLPTVENGRYQVDVPG